MIDTIASDVSLAISGLFVLTAAVLLVLRLRWRRQMKRCRLSQRRRLSKLMDLSRDDIDPHWQAIKDTLPGCAGDMEPPPEWDPCVVRDPKNPQQGEGQ